jgi:hypothetical protein
MKFFPSSIFLNAEFDRNRLMTERWQAKEA